MKFRRTIVTLLIIVFLFWCGSKMAENQLYTNIRPIYNNVISFILLAGVATAGYLGIPPSIKWIRSLWAFVYFFVLILLCVLILINRYAGLNSIKLHLFSIDLKMIFMGPIPFAIAILIAFGDLKRLKHS